MTHMYFLNNNGKVVKKFVVRSVDKDNAVSQNSKIRDQISKVNAELIFSKQISETAYFMVVSFDDYIMKTVWESNIFSANIKAEDIVASKVLIIKNEENIAEAKAKCDKVKEVLRQYDGAVLSETKIAEGEYRLVLFFTDKEKMLACEETIGVVGT